MICQLYKLLKKNLAMSLPNFFEMFPTDTQTKIEMYFQPRFLLNGKNFCAHDYQIFKQKIDHLKEALDFKPDNIKRTSFKDLQYIQNSVLYENCLPIIPQDEPKSIETMHEMCIALNLNQFYDLQVDFMRYESII